MFVGEWMEFYVFDLLFVKLVFWYCGDLNCEMGFGCEFEKNLFGFVVFFNGLE